MWKTSRNAYMSHMLAKGTGVRVLDDVLILWIPHIRIASTKTPCWHLSNQPIPLHSTPLHSTSTRHATCRTLGISPVISSHSRRKTQHIGMYVRTYTAFPAFFSLPCFPLYRIPSPMPPRLTWLVENPLLEFSPCVTSCHARLPCRVSFWYVFGHGGAPFRALRRSCRQVRGGAGCPWESA